MSKSLYLILLLCAGALLVLPAGGCRDESAELLLAAKVPLVDTLVSFEQDVLRLVQAYCSTSGCHDGSSVLAVSLRSYAEIRPLADSIRAEVINRRMPVGISLRPEEIDVFVRWIDQGARNY
ncbi:MAG: hypothetical protein OHK0039_45180 [Bacteroidia bacterium]